MQNTQKKTNVKLMTQLAVLTAIIAVMAFTPLGYLRVGVISITFLTIPVVIGSIILGPKAGAFLGGIFGITSFIQCFGMDPFGTSLANISIVRTLILCMVPRILCGVLPALIFNALNKHDKTKLVSYAVASISAPIINTAFFVSGLVLMFWKTDYVKSLNPEGKGIFGFMIAFIGINGIVEALATLLAGTAIAKAIHHYLRKI